MIYKPMTWKNYRIGCYYLRQTPFSKIPIDHVKTCKLYEHNDISRVIKCLDLLGEVKWRINQKVLDVIEYIWSTGGGVGEIPQRYNDRVISRNIIRETKDYTDKLQLLKESQHNRELHSLRCDFMIKLTIARNFAKCKEIYFPHNIDYRGRAYPISPHLNHIGNDLCRGLLEYSEKKPLGKEGLNWLKVNIFII
jgi:DNA-directed RNA polymerase